MMKKVYLTALTNERYIPGVMALARSLQEVKSEYELAVMIPAEKAETLGAAIRAYGVLNIPNTFLLPKENICLAEMDMVIEKEYSYWRDSFFKLQAVGCTEYDKIILLDCDQMVVKNIDHLFEKAPFTATTCGRCVHEDWIDLSAGLLVLEPSRELHEQLISLILPAIEFKKRKGQQAGDQDVFKMYFPDWRNHPEKYLHEKYNICWGWIGDLCRKESITPEDFYMIHFPGKKKPWDMAKNHHFRILLSCLAKGKLDWLSYKLRIWRKYRHLCEPLKKA